MIRVQNLILVGNLLIWTQRLYANLVSTRGNQILEADLTRWHWRLLLRTVIWAVRLVRRARIRNTIVGVGAVAEIVDDYLDQVELIRAEAPQPNQPSTRVALLFCCFLDRARASSGDRGRLRLNRFDYNRCDLFFLTR